MTMKTEAIVLTSTPSGADGSWHYAAFLDLEITLAQIRDVRIWLSEIGTQARTPAAQAYRDRWAALCRKLCRDGRPTMRVVA